MKTKCHLLEEIRNYFHMLVYDSMEALLTALLRGIVSGRSKITCPDDTAMTVPSNSNKIGEKTSVFGKTGTLFLSAP